jgi:predicted DNA-binding transcriptional regulator AlpA
VDRLCVAIERLCGLVEDLRSVVETMRQPSPGVGVDLLTAEDVARAIGVSERTLRRLRSRRDFPKPLRGPGPLRWRRSTVLAYLEQVK